MHLKVLTSNTGACKFRGKSLLYFLYDEHVASLNSGFFSRYNVAIRREQWSFIRSRRCQSESSHRGSSVEGWRGNWNNGRRSTRFEPARTRACSPLASASSKTRDTIDSFGDGDYAAVRLLVVRSTELVDRLINKTHNQILPKIIKKPRRGHKKQI